MSDDVVMHKNLGVDLFNYTWDLLEKPDRTRAENDTMIHAAHASRFHWEKAGGTAVNLARGEWQVSRVYAVLGRVESAQYHAQRSLEICQENGIGDFDLAFAYEALARAASVAGDAVLRAKYLDLAKEASRQIANQEDRNVVLHDLETI